MFVVVFSFIKNIEGLWFFFYMGGWFRIIYCLFVYNKLCVYFIEDYEDGLFGNGESIIFELFFNYMCLC